MYGYTKGYLLVQLLKHMKDSLEMMWPSLHKSVAPTGKELTPENCLLISTSCVQRQACTSTHKKTYKNYLSCIYLSQSKIVICVHKMTQQSKIYTFLEEEIDFISQDPHRLPDKP